MPPRTRATQIQKAKARTPKRAKPRGVVAVEVPQVAAADKEEDGLVTTVRMSGRVFVV